jgi:steroid delta-isomerase-like uncharacterized protein
MSIETNTATALRSSEEDNTALVLRLVEETINRGNLAVADDVFAADYVEHSGPPGLPQGPENWKLQIALFRNAYPDLTHDTEDIFAAGDRVVERWTARGTHLGELFGVPPTGKVMQTSGIHIFRIADGKIAEHWGNSDDLGAMRSLGLLPPFA